MHGAHSSEPECLFSTGLNAFASERHPFQAIKQKENSICSIPDRHLHSIGRLQTGGNLRETDGEVVFALLDQRFLMAILLRNCFWITRFACSRQARGQIKVLQPESRRAVYPSTASCAERANNLEGNIKTFVLACNYKI